MTGDDRCHSGRGRHSNGRSQYHILLRGVLSPAAPGGGAFLNVGFSLVGFF